MEDLARQLIAFIETHQEWAVAIIFIAALGESFAFLSLLLPGTALLIAAGALVQAGNLSMAQVALGAVLGALLGDAASYWIGRQFGARLAGVWPFTRHPELLAAGIQFFRRHGGKSVFIGRFFGPMRAVVPLAAGMMRMPQRRFWLASIFSAAIWAPMLLLVGDVLASAGHRIVGPENTVLIVFGGMLLLGVLAALWAALRAVRQKG
jgi:membrane protein DedA with SNARE-associated domain